MDEQSQKKFDEIISKEILALTDSDKEFLRARSPYLSAVQKEVYEEVLKGENQPVVIPTEEKTTNTSELSYRDLQRKAKGYGLKYVGVSKDNLLKDIDTIEGPGGADKPL